jgi:hypothetical protein
VAQPLERFEIRLPAVSSVPPGKFNLSKRCRPQRRRESEFKLIRGWLPSDDLRLWLQIIFRFDGSFIA